MSPLKHHRGEPELLQRAGAGLGGLFVRIRAVRVPLFVSGDLRRGFFDVHVRRPVRTEPRLVRGGIERVVVRRRRRRVRVEGPRGRDRDRALGGSAARASVVQARRLVHGRAQRGRVFLEARRDRAHGLGSAHFG